MIEEASLVKKTWNRLYNFYDYCEDIIYRKFIKKILEIIEKNPSKQ